MAFSGDFFPPNTFIKATQDAKIRLHFEKTPTGIKALCTDGIETCIGLVFIGSAGMSLAHISRPEDIKLLVSELDFVGDFERVVIATNPGQFLAENKVVMDAELPKLFEAKGIVLTEENLEYIEIPNGALLALQNKTVMPTNKTVTQCAILAPQAAKRCAITAANHCILTSESVDHDLQYDGEKWLPAPPLMGDAKAVMSMLLHDKGNMAELDFMAKQEQIIPWFAGKLDHDTTTAFFPMMNQLVRSGYYGPVRSGVLIGLLAKVLEVMSSPDYAAERVTENPQVIRCLSRLTGVKFSGIVDADVKVNAQACFSVSSEANNAADSLEAKGISVARHHRRLISGEYLYMVEVVDANSPENARKIQTAFYDEFARTDVKVYVSSLAFKERMYKLDAAVATSSAAP